MAKNGKKPKKRPSKFNAQGLTDKQVAVLDAAQKVGLGRNVTVICKEAGVSRPTFYEWFKEPQFAPFVREWESLPGRMLQKHLPGILIAQIHQAQDGSTPATRLLMEYAGLLEQKIKIDGEMKHTVTERVEKLTDGFLNRIRAGDVGGGVPGNGH